MALNKIKTHMEGYTFMLFLKALHDFKMLNDSSLIGGARLHWSWPYLSMLAYLCTSFFSDCQSLVLLRWLHGPGNGRVCWMFPHPSALSYTQGVSLVMWCLDELHSQINKWKKGNLESEIKLKCKCPLGLQDTIAREVWPHLRVW